MLQSHHSETSNPAKSARKCMQHAANTFHFSFGAILSCCMSLQGQQFEVDRRTSLAKDTREFRRHAAASFRSVIRILSGHVLRPSFTSMVWLLLARLYISMAKCIDYTITAGHAHICRSESHCLVHKADLLAFWCSSKPRNMCCTSPTSAGLGEFLQDAL